MLSGTVSEPAINGVATFADLSLDQAGTYTLKATDGALTSVTSANFSIAPEQLSGFYTVSVLANFDPTTGSNPSDGVVMDSAGNLFGTTGGDGRQ